VTQDLENFLRPEEIARISRLELRARRIVEGFVSGLHRSPYFGQSLEFLQHREYVAGGYVIRCKTQPGTQTLWTGLQLMHCLALAWDVFGPAH
jgi:hypothetical protein